LSRIVPLYFSSAPLPAGLNPHSIFCPVSWARFTKVHVSTPRLPSLFSACTMVTGGTAMSEAQTTATNRMSTTTDGWCDCKPHAYRRETADQRDEPDDLPRASSRTDFHIGVLPLAPEPRSEMYENPSASRAATA